MAKRKKNKKPFQISLTENITSGENELCITAPKQGTITIPSYYTSDVITDLLKVAEILTEQSIKKRKK